MGTMNNSKQTATPAKRRQRRIQTRDGGHNNGQSDESLSSHFVELTPSSSREDLQRGHVDAQQPNEAGEGSVMERCQPTTGPLPTSGESECRTMDAFLESAYHRRFHGVSGDSSILADLCDTSKLSYHIIILALGLANASDASEILCLSYLLSDSQFQEEILSGGGGGGDESDDSHIKGGMVSSSVFL